MTRSIFDPGGPDVERGGTRNVGPEAENISHMPPDVVDGNVAESQSGEHDDQTEPIAGEERELERDGKRSRDARP